MKRLTRLVLFAVVAIPLAAVAWVRFPSRGQLPSAKAPPSITWGPPERPLRIVSYNILHNQRGREGILQEIRKLRPDILLLQEVESRDVVDMARALGMSQLYEGQVYYPSQNLAGPRASWGNAILSTRPIFNAASIPNPGGGSFGVWCDVVDGQHKFRVANVHLSATWKVSLSHFKESANFRHKELTHLKDAWISQGSPPMIVGGDFNNLAAGDNYWLMSNTWTDALGELGETHHTFVSGIIRTRIDYFLTSKQFRAVEGGVVPTAASDHRPIWVTLAAK